MHLHWSFDFPPLGFFQAHLFSAQQVFLLLSKFSEPQLFMFHYPCPKWADLFLPTENNPTLLPSCVIRDHDERNETENGLLSACSPGLPHALPSLQLIDFLWRRYAGACTVAVGFPTPWGAPEEERALLLLILTTWLPPSSSPSQGDP